MSIVHPLDLTGPHIFRCAQAGCAECIDRLLRRQACGDAAYADLLQEGRIGLWQAVLHFDPARAWPFWSGVPMRKAIKGRRACIA